MPTSEDFAEGDRVEWDVNQLLGTTRTVQGYVVETGLETGTCDDVLKTQPDTTPEQTALVTAKSARRLE